MNRNFRYISKKQKKIKDYYSQHHQCMLDDCPPLKQTLSSSRNSIRT